MELSSMKTCQIVIVVDRYWPSLGGVEQAARALAAAFPDAWQVKILTHRPSNRTGLYAQYTDITAAPDVDPAKKNIEYLDAGRRGRLLLLPLLLWRLPLLRKLIPREFHDLLYFWYRLTYAAKIRRSLAEAGSVHCISTGYLARTVSEVCLDSGIRFVHEPFIHFDRWGDSPAQMRAYALADVVICPTESFKSKFAERLDPSYDVTVKVIPPVIVDPHYPKISIQPVPGRFVLFLGRREAHKGLAELLVAFSGLEHLASLVVAGPGEQLHSRNMAVLDLGEVDDKIKMWLLASCDILCVPSSDESFGIVFAEAMSFGKPVVAFDVAPVNEIVKNGQNGILVPPDDTDGLHRALETLLTDLPLLKGMGEASKQRFEKYYASEVVIEKIIGVHHVLSQKG